VQLQRAETVRAASAAGGLSLDLDTPPPQQAFEIFFDSSQPARVEMKEEAPEAPAPKPTPHAPISGGVLNGKAIHLVTPPYPAIARSAHASGPVQVQVLIDENGNVVSANAVSGDPLLRAAAVAAAHASKFSPTKLSGQPVKVNGVIIYNFVAQ